MNASTPNRPFPKPLASLTRWLAPAALVLLVSAAVAQSTVSFRADQWYPYNGTPSDLKPGYVVEILRAVFEKEGSKVDYAIMPWKRAVLEAEKGTANGVICALKSDTPEFVFPEEPIGYSENTLFVKKGSTWTFSGLETLKGRRLGIVSGYSYGEPLDGYIKQSQTDAKAIDESSGDSPVEQAIRKLQAGRIDAFVESKTVFWAQVAKMGLNRDEFVEAGRASEPEAMYVSFSPKKDDAKALAAKLTAGIRALRSSGELAKILDRYQVKDWSK